MMQKNKISIISAIKRSYADLYKNLGIVIGVFGLYIALSTILFSYFFYSIYDALGSGVGLNIKFIVFPVLGICAFIFLCKACCDWMSYLSNSDGFLNVYSAFKPNIENWSFVVNVLILLISITVFSLILMIFVACIMFGLAHVFGAEFSMGALNLNVRAKDLSITYLIMGIGFALMVAVYTALIVIVLKRVLKFPSISVGLDLDNDAAGVLAQGYKMKIFVSYIVACVVPLVCIEFVHDQFFDTIKPFFQASSGVENLLSSMYFALDIISINFIYVLIGFMIPCSLLYHFFKDAYDQNKDKLEAL